MSKAISLFSGYSQSENRTTNYCLLLLKMFYEENPKFLAEVMATLIGENMGDSIGVSFHQQERKSSSVPDGLIVQPAFTVYIETKNWDWFYREQLENHLDALSKERPGLKALLALANFETTDREKFNPIRELCAEKYSGEIVFEDVSFDDFVDALQRLKHMPKNLADAVDEFRSYLDEQDLLPSWQRRLDVVNCAGKPDDVLNHNVYLCPATGGAYNHQRCKYFGMYRNKRIEQVALIEAVVDVESQGNATIKWKNENNPENEFKERAESHVGDLRKGEYPIRVFLLGRLYKTDCVKDTSGGMQTSKQYFDIFHLKVDGAEHLAQTLSGMTWSDVRI